jgi:hypothetical protein
MLAFLSKPATWLVVGLAVVALLTFGFFQVRAAWRAEGEAKADAAAKQAIIDQKAKDAALSAQLVTQLQGQIQTLAANAAPVREEIKYVPVTKGCGPAVNRAADWVRDALGSGGSPARP